MADEVTAEFLREYLSQEYISKDERDKAAKAGQAMPNGDYPIRNATELKAAIRLVGRSSTYSSDQVKSHIIKRARAMGLTNLLPDDWNVTQEARRFDPDNDGDDDSSPDTDTDHDFWTEDGQPIIEAWRRIGRTPPQVTQETGNVFPLLLENIGKPQVVQEASPDNGGVLRFRVPFYVGNSTSRAPGYSKRILWQESTLPEIIRKGKERIASRRPPLTTYARHAHALAGDQLPIGRPVDLEQEGRIGYAIIEVLPVEPYGKGVQTLVQHQAIDAVSLRASEHRLVEKKVNGESMLVCEALALDGIDMAPDSPAQETYGIELLTQEARIEDIAPAQGDPAPPPKQRNNKLDEPLTLETVRASDIWQEIVDGIEKPLKDQLATVTAERDRLVQENEIRDRDAAISDYAAKTADPEAFKTALTSLCDEEKITNRAGVNAVVAPLLMQELESRGKTPEHKPSQREELSKLFHVGGAGKTGDEETGGDGKPAPLTQEVLATRGTVDGGLIPEDD